MITLPNDAHATVATDALDRGVHVCCEKPLTIRFVDAQALAAAARRGRATLFTAFHRRYNRNLVHLAGQLAGKRHRIDRITARYHENSHEHSGGEGWYLDPDRCGGGCVIDNGPNALDTVRFLVGDLAMVDATIGDIRSGAEYEGIVADFRNAVDTGDSYRDPGPDIVGLVERAYRLARTKETRLRMPPKDVGVARMVKLLFHSRYDRGMVLSEWRSRCISVGEVHELVTTIDDPERTGDRVDRVAFLGFAEFHSPAVVERGDEVWVGSRQLGVVAGFDEAHYPNHYNILISSDRLRSAGDVDLGVGDEVRFVESQRR
ncbi:MAG: Gfo/Idh/MocA family protein [Acidimicrobiales bacterium]